MAEIRVERKRAVWPWILLALVLLALIVWLFFLGDRDAPEPTDVVPAPPVGEASQAPAEPAPATVPDTQSEAGQRPEAVSAFLTFVEERNAEQSASPAHEYTAAGLHRLADALNAIAESDPGQEATASAELQELETVRAQAEAMQKDPQSLQHADQAREAFSSAASAMQNLQKSRFPQLGEQVGGVQEAAAGVDPKRPLLEQTEAIEQFFQRSAAALRAMTESRA
jgi:hypothetical protein